MSIVKFCGSLKITPEWLATHARDLEIAWPRCMYCGRRVRPGGLADHHWPFYDQFSFHASCHRKAKAEKKQ